MKDDRPLVARLRAACFCKEVSRLATCKLCEAADELERLTIGWDETEECLAAILNELDLPFQDKDEPMPEYQKRCIAALRASSTSSAPHLTE